MTDERNPDCRIYLILPKTLDRHAVDVLPTLLEETDIACMLARPDYGGHFDQDILNNVVGLSQSHNVACLIDNDWELALKLGADGIHLSSGLETEEEADDSISVYEIARAALGEDAIIGGLCTNRHSAMLLGELGAQYVALPTALENSEELTAQEQVQWWSELFELPCVAWDVKDLGDIDPFIQNGADFIALGGIVWENDNPTEVMRQVSRIIR